MKAKSGYKRDKGKFSTGGWLKRYFGRNTCRKTCCRNENSEQLTKDRICPDCNDTGVIDTFGHPLEMPCQKCDESGKL